MLNQALGYLRVATASLLADEQATGFAMKALDAQAVLEENGVEPAYIGTHMSAADALAAAAHAIADARAEAPPAVWVLVAELLDPAGQ